MKAPTLVILHLSSIAYCILLSINSSLWLALIIYAKIKIFVYFILFIYLFCAIYLIIVIISYIV